MRARHNLPAPTLGVSTLAARNQPEGMMTEQINMRSDPVRKLSRRPSMQYSGVLDTTVWKAYQKYERGGVVYEVGVTEGNEVRVVRDGVVTTTKTQDASIANYLAGATRDDLAIHTIEDTSFILNKSKTVASLEDHDNVPEYVYINVVSALNYGEEIKVTLQWDDTSNIGNRSTVLDIVRNNTFSILIPNADDGDYTDADKARATRAVAEEIRDSINALLFFEFTTPLTNRTGTEICNATNIGSVVSIAADTLPNLSIQVDGGQGESSIVPITATKQDTSGMPKYAVVGSHVTIQPGLEADSDDGTYYLTAKSVTELSPPAGEVMSEVYWTETAIRSGDNTLDGSTMPIVVIQDPIPTVVNDNTLWGKRVAGDAKSSPLPAFVGNTIKALATYQGRLVVGTGDKVVMSNTEDLYLFSRESVLQLLATDAVELGSSSTDTGEITGFGIHNRDLIINFPKKQFKVSGASPITALSTAMTPATAYETAAKPSPLSLAGSLLLPFSYGDSGGIWDYTQKEQNDQNTAMAITSMVEGYMTSDIELWAASSTLDMAVVKCAGNILYVYEQTTRQNARVQMSWSKWDLQLEEDIIWLGFDNNLLEIVTVTDSATKRRTVDLSTVTPDAADNIYLDDMVAVTVTNGQTTGTLPTDYPDHEDLTFVQTSDCKSPYYEAQATRTGNTLTFSTPIHKDGDATVFVGRGYTSEFTPTRQFVREEGQVVDIDRLSIKQLLLDVVHTNLVRMDTISEYYDKDTTTVLADRVGNMKLGVKSFYTGDFTFPVRKQAKWATQRFFTDGYLPMNVIAMTWQATYKQRMGRL